MYPMHLLLFLAACGGGPQPAAPETPQPVETDPAPDPFTPAPSSTPPTDVDPFVHGDGVTPQQARPYFDTFSWQSFVAFAWPANGADRATPRPPNTPATLLDDHGKSPTVFETMRPVTALFPPDPASKTGFTPPPYKGAGAPVCGNAPPDALVLEQLTKGISGNVAEGEVSEAFSGPLVDQWGQYTRYQIHVGQAEYDFVAKNALYLIANQPTIDQPGFPITLPPESGPKENSVEIKSAWRPMQTEATGGRPADDLSRYLVREAYLVPADHTAGQDCPVSSMGLVGLHVAVKTVSQPHWIWATFEQVDNVVVGPGAPAGTLPSYNDGAPTPAVLAAGYDAKAAKAAGITGTPPNHIKWDNTVKDPGTPIAVARVNAIPTGPVAPSTVDLNGAWQKALAGTPLASYELVVTQWATDNSTFDPTGNTKTSGDYPAKAGQPFPTFGALNTTMETYFQTTNPQPDNPDAGDSCMECHYGAASTDMSWMIKNRAQ